MKKDNSIKKIFLCIYPLFIWGIGQILTGIIFQLFYIFKNVNNGTSISTQDMIGFINNNTMLILLFSSVINIFIFMFILYKTNNLNLRINSNINKLSLLTLSAIMGISFYMLSMGIITFFDLTRYSSQYIDTMEILSSGGIILNIISVGIITPISEELMLRGLVYNNLKKYINIRSAIFIQALLFGILHMNIIQGTYAVLAGILIGYVYEKSNSLIASSVFHISFNLCNHLFEVPVFSFIMGFPLGMFILGLFFFLFSIKCFNRVLVK